MTPQFIRANSLTDDQVAELVAHDTVDVDGFLYREWRKDVDGETWLMRIASEIHGIQPDNDMILAESEGFIDAPADNDPDSDNPVECEWIYDGDDDE